MTIAVVIPTLNEEQALPRTLCRTIGLGFDEIIVVDGGSNDRTREIVSRFEVRRSKLQVATSDLEPHTTPLAVLTSPSGRARQMNRGAAEANSDVLLFLHADTLLPCEAKDAILSALRDPACVGGRFDVRFDRDSRLSRVIGAMMNLRSRLTGIATGDQAIFVRKTVFERMGGYADIPLMEDIDFTKRLRRMGRVAALSATVVTSYRRWDLCGPVRTILLMWTLRLLYWLGIRPERLARFYAAVREPARG
ncbi:MAG TPA: TIGR04283 family arsenosugar biosynthesis glycosyltransferase [Nitrospiraceae bacterium]|jgi:rSAM/selenodomain-associated transferase 2|nr:TIGR04283 family arsenosugar biosynthesis glycosyltransferase [Nitrospiraceae bacterium]